MISPQAISDKLRAALEDYEPMKLEGDELAYLKELKLPEEIEAFYLSHAPAQSVGHDALLLSIVSMREEHDDMEPGTTVRAAGACVLATANGNPYFVVAKDSGYEIRFVDGDEVSEECDRDALVELSADAPMFTSFDEFIDALIADVLPSSPHEGEEAMKKLATWRVSR